jgi:hypothetical protein
MRIGADRRPSSPQSYPGVATPNSDEVGLVGQNCYLLRRSTCNQHLSASTTAMAGLLWLAKAKVPVYMCKQRNNPRQLKMFAFTEPVRASKAQAAGLCQQWTLFAHRRNLLLHDCLWRMWLLLPVHGGGKHPMNIVTSGAIPT